MDEYSIHWMLGELSAASSSSSEEGSCNSRTALVLASGGLAGAVYEIGALRAIDDLLVDRAVNDFDIFIGTSAGALIATLLAADVTPCEMFQTLDGTHPSTQKLRSAALFSLNLRDYIRRGLRLPGVLTSTAWRAVRSPADVNLFDLIASVAGALPAGLYDPVGIEEYLTRALEFAGGYKTFADLPKDLFLIATELDTGARAVFSRETTPHVSLARAVSASCALPVVYRPVEIDGVEYVDGGVRGTASLDLAVEHGARLIVCINPIVPISSERLGKPRLSQRGVSAVALQSFRALLHSSLAYQIKQLKRRHPEVDFILIEPRPDDEVLFVENIMRYSARIRVAQRGFEAVTVDLAQDYEAYKTLLARHGIPITRRLVNEELRAIQNAGHDRHAVQRVLERSARCPAPAGRDALSYELVSTLVKLDRLLERRIAQRHSRA